jgi:ABC-2 type transport system ATP-binding protein
VLTAVTAEAERQGITVTSLTVDQRSLESVFLDITGREIRA